MSQVLLAENRNIEYKIGGKGKPSIIFLNGNGMSFQRAWSKLPHSLSENGTLFFYNRAGIGKSSKPEEPQSGEVVINTLRDLLKKLNLEPPYVLVGHSSGGLFANLFARLHPEETKAVIFVDAAHPKEFEVTIPQYSTIQKFYINLLIRLSKKSEIFSLEESCKTVLLSGAFPNVPIEILTGAKVAQAKWLPWNLSASIIDTKIDLHKDLAAMSSISRHHISKKSGHGIMITEPQIVADAIRAAIA